MKSTSLFARFAGTNQVRFATVGVGLSLGLSIVSPLMTVQMISAQTIIPEGAGGTGTQVMQQGDRALIEGGRLSGDGSNLFHSFEKFSVNQGQIADFLSNPEIHNIFGRVFGGDASLINGVLQVTGGDSNLYLMNPAGFLFGANAQLNLPGNFTATTATGIQFDENWFSATGPNPYAALSGPATGFSFGALQAGSILNAGELEVGAGHSLTLLGGSVVNTGQLVAPAGQVLVTAVPESGLVRLQAPGSVLSLEIDPTKLGEGPNDWAISAADLPTLLTRQSDAASADGAEFPGVSVAASGEVLLEPSGVQLPNEPGLAVVSGQVDVSGELGGTVGVFGSRVGLVEGEIDASGLNGGGEVLLGGEFQGKGPVPNAQQTVVSRGGVIAADATRWGDGGRVIVWADGGTRFEGSLSARGGAEAGNGGFAEVSGKENLFFDGQASLSASAGRNGQLLLDPRNILISGTLPDQNSSAVFDDSFVGDVTLSEAKLQELSEDNLELRATGDIIIDSLDTGYSPDKELRDSPEFRAKRLGGNESNFTLQASGDIIVRNPVEGVLFFNGGSGEINFIADDNFQMDADSTIQAASPQPSMGDSMEDSMGDSGRNFTIEAKSIEVGGINLRSGIPRVGDQTGAPGGNLRLNAQENITIKGVLQAFADSDIPFPGGERTFNPYKGGDIEIRAGGSIQVDTYDSAGEIFTSASIRTGGAGGIGGNVLIKANGDINIPPPGAGTVSGGSERAGNISIISDNGSVNIIPNKLMSEDDIRRTIGSGSSGNLGGDLLIQAKNDINLLTLDTKSPQQSGSIEITSREGAISIDGNISAAIPENQDNAPVGTNGGDITLSAAEEIRLKSSTITAAGTQQAGQITFNAPVVLEGNVKVEKNPSPNNATTAVEGDVIFESSISGETLSIDTEGLLSFGGNVDVEQLQIVGASQVDINGDLKTRGSSLELDSPLNLLTDSRFDTGDCSTTGGCTISLGGNLAAENRILTLASDRIELNTEINTKQLNILTDEVAIGADIVSNDGLTFAPRTPNRDIYLGQENTAGLSLTNEEIGRISGAGNLQIGSEQTGNIFTNAALTLNTPTTLQPGTDRIIQLQQDITSNGDRLTFDGPTQITNPIQISAPATPSTLQFNGPIIEATNATNPALTLFTETLELNDTVDLETLNIQADTINLNAAITTGNQLILAPRTASRNISLGTATPNSLNLSTEEISRINGSGILQIGDAQTGNITVNEALTFNASTELQPGDGNALQLEQNLTSNADSLTLNGSSEVAGDIEIRSTAGTVRLNDEIRNSSATPNSSLSVSSDTLEINGTATLDNLEITTDNLTLSGQLDTGSTTMIAPRSAGQTLELGNSTASDRLNITPDELARISGTGNLQIGNEQTGNLLITENLTFNTPATLQPGSSSLIQLQQNITSNGDRLTFSGPTQITNVVQVNTTATPSTLQFNGPITETADATNSALTLSTDTLELNDTIELTTFNIEADNLSFNSGITSGDRLTVAPRTASRDISLGTTTPNSLNLTPEEISRINGSGTLQIGDAQTGNITVNEALTFNASAELQPGDSSTLQLEQNLTSNADTLTLNGNTEVANNITINSVAGTIRITDELRNSSATPDATLAITANTLEVNGTTNLTNLDVAADNLTLNGQLNSGTATTLAPRSVGREIELGDSVGSDRLTLTPDELTRIRGNGLVQIGSEQSGNIAITAPVTLNAPIQLQPGNGQSIQVQQDVNTTGERLSFNAPTQITNDITISSAAGSGNIQFNGAVNSANGNRQLRLGAGGGRIEFADDVGAGVPFEQLTIESAVGLDIAGDITTINDLTLRQPLVLEDNVALRSTSGGVTVGNSTSPTGASLTLNSSVSVTTGNLASQGGDITLGQFDNPPSSITAGNLTTQGGDIGLIARDRINTGLLDSSNPVGDGGDVFIDPEDNITIGAINAQGGPSGTGGTVDLTTARFFQATDSFVDQNGILASISAAGGAGEGNIVIRHDGGDRFTPFNVFDSLINGTDGALTTGADNVISGRSFPGSYTQGNIRIITSDRLTQVVPNEDPEAITALNLEEEPFGLDEYFTRQLETYLGRSEQVPVKSLKQIQDELRQLEKQTGSKSALIYAVFSSDQFVKFLEQQNYTSSANVMSRSRILRSAQKTDQLFLALVSAEGLVIKPVEHEKATRDLAEKPIRTFREEILVGAQHYSLGYPKTPPRHLDEAQLMYQWFLEPLQSEVERLGIDNLIYVMEAGLRSVPLASLSAMHDREAYVIESRSVSMMPSFSITDTRYGNIRKTQLVGMGASEFGSVLDELPAVPEELNQVVDLWAPTNDEPFLNAEFRPEVLAQEQRGRPIGIVHLATHGIFNSGDPKASFIQMGQGKAQRVSLEKMPVLGLTSAENELFVLSACETANDNGRNDVELGFAGMAVQLGVKASLASVWEVNDLSTLVFMAQFYRELQQPGTTKAEAVRRTQLAMLKGEVFIEDGALVFQPSSDVLQSPESQSTDSKSTAKQVQPSQIILKANLDESIPDYDLAEGKLKFAHPHAWAGFTLVGNPW